MEARLAHRLEQYLLLLCGPATGSRWVGGLTNSLQSPVTCLFFLSIYRASFMLPLPSSMATIIFMVAVLMVVALVGLLLWLFTLRES